MTHEDGNPDKHQAKARSYASFASSGRSRTANPIYALTYCRISIWPVRHGEAKQIYSPAGKHEKECDFFPSWGNEGEKKTERIVARETRSAHASAMTETISGWQGKLRQRSTRGPSWSLVARRFSVDVRIR